MADIVFILIAVAFFALCFAYVRGCERIIGRDTNETDADASTSELNGAEVTRK